MTDPGTERTVEHHILQKKLQILNICSTQNQETISNQEAIKFRETLLIFQHISTKTTNPIVNYKSYMLRGSGDERPVEKTQIGKSGAAESVGFFGNGFRGMELVI